VKILIVVSVADKPYGGHYHTTFTYLNALAKEYHVKLLVIGNEKPDWLNQYSAEFIYYNGLNIFTTLQKVKDIAKNYDALHAFDEFAYFFIRAFSQKCIVYTRCGGPNPAGRYYPWVDKLVCLSHENFMYFNKSIKVNTLALVPNRVPSFSSDEILISKLKSEYSIDDDRPVLLRICRIDRYYRKSIEQTINLGVQLINCGLKVQLLILGAVYDDEFFDELSKKYPAVVFVVEEQFTKDAKLVLSCADMVVGTGRSLMEAALKGKIVFSPVANSDLPSLLTLKNINHFFNTNFSERATIEKCDDLNINDVLSLFNSDEEKDRYQAEIVKFSERNFLLDSIPAQLKLYYSSSNSKVNARDYYRQLLRVTSVFIRFSFRKIRENITHN
jgi:hypothetical protein